jgi:hypothetical protein
MSTLLLVVGIILALIGGIGMLIVAFRESVLWGIGCLLIPLVSLIFVISHWDEAKKPFLIQLAGVVLLILGGAMDKPAA